MDAQAQHFDRVAEQYDRTQPAHIVAHYLRKRVAVIAPLLQGKRGLEVGCGTGRLLEALRPYGVLTGVDPSEGMLDVLRRQGRGAAVLGAAEQLPFPDETFDLVYSVAMLHHLILPEKVAAALREMVRVAKRGGAILVWDHNPLNPYWPVIMRASPQDRGDERLVPSDEVLRGLRAAGVREAQLRRSGFVPEFVPRALMPVAAALEALVERAPLLRRLCAHNVFIAVK